MKIGKLNLKKVSTDKLGAHYEIQVSNTETKELVIINGNSVTIRVSEATAKKLAKALKWANQSLK